MKFLVLNALTEDLLTAVVELDRRSLGGLWTLEGYRREIDSPNSDLMVLQFSEFSEAEPAPNSPIVGLACLWAIANEAHITTLAIDPDYQQQGLGQLLLLAMLWSARQRGLEWATLEVRVSNQPAIALYRKFGFQDVGLRRKYYQDTGEDALILWRSGVQKPEFEAALRQWWVQINGRLSQLGWKLSLNSPFTGILPKNPEIPLDASPLFY